jgi:hypothetical protein
VWTALICACILVGSIGAQQEAEAPAKAEEARRRAAEIEAKIRALQDEHDRLLGQAELAELAAERQEEFKNIQTETREYLLELREELEETRGELEEEDGAWRALALARIKNIRERIAICERILKLPDPSTLPMARKLQRTMEVADTMWWMVIEPKIVGAAELEDMVDTVREHGNDADLVALMQQFREVYKADAVAAEKQFRLWLGRREGRDKTERLTEAFHLRAGQLEGKEAVDERRFEEPPG